MTADIDTAVPDGETPAATCPYCDRPFRSERSRDLHLGRSHPDQCSETEWGAYEAADEEERDELFFFHMKVVVALGVLYSVGVLVYMVVLSF
ncbi:MAG: DNA-binding protein [Halobacteriales archaeon]|nr:DNA-binding protein [Halobacteriales archaeon]